MDAIGGIGVAYESGCQERERFGVRMSIDLFVRGLRRLRTLQPVFGLKQAPHW